MATKEALGEIWPPLETISSACESLGISFFVVGAAARDLQLEVVYGVKLIRATRDVDIGIAVRDWNEYAALMACLENDLDFERDRMEHRMKKGSQIIDVIPFGDIADEAARIHWPEGEKVMSVLGYKEAYEGAVRLDIHEGPTVRVASLPGIAIMKLVAWNEHPHDRRQDPIDLCTIMKNYDEVVGMDLFDSHNDLLDDQFDNRYAHARILGRDMAPLLNSDTLRNSILSILDRNLTDEHDSPLIQSMAVGADCFPESTVRFRCLEEMRQGILDRLRWPQTPSA